jgi:hypothetical protein
MMLFVTVLPSLSNVRIYPQSLFPGDRGESRVIIMTTVWAGWSCLNFSRCKRFLSVSQNVHGPAQTPLKFRWVKGPGCEVDHLTPSSANVKNEWNCTSALPCVPSWCGQGQLCHLVPFMF